MWGPKKTSGHHAIKEDDIAHIDGSTGSPDGMTSGAPDALDIVLEAFKLAGPRPLVMDQIMLAFTQEIEIGLIQRRYYYLRAGHPPHVALRKAFDDEIVEVLP